MSKKDQALYELANLASSPSLDDRMFSSIDAVADRVKLSRSTVGRAVQHLCERGAAEWTGGYRNRLVLSSPDKTLDHYKALWDRKTATIGRISTDTAEKLVGSGDAVWGGVKAALHHGSSDAASPHFHTIYVTDASVIDSLPEGDTVVYRWVTNTLPEGGYATLAQTITELFATPGFVANEFYMDLWDARIRKRW